MGPTSIGKTEIAVAAAKLLKSRGLQPIAISADAIQVYKGLEILSGARDALDQNDLVHELIGCVEISERFTVGRFSKLAHQLIDNALQDGKVPIVVGGTGLYVQAALCKLDLRPEVPEEIHKKVKLQVDEQGSNFWHGQLALSHPKLAEKLNPNDSQRIARTLELLEIGFEPSIPDPNKLWTDDLRHPTRLIGLVQDRQKIRERIPARVHRMIEQGAQQEVVAADQAGASETARKALGFSSLLNGDIDQMVNDTRRYVKRQLTWMRKMPGIELLDIDDFGDINQVAAEIVAPWLPKP